MSAEWVRRAKVGDKVVCVDDSPLYKNGKGYLRSGALYTISRIEETIGQAPDGYMLSTVGFALAEVQHPQEGMGPGFGIFGAFRFRPVHPRKTDISFAHEILRKATKPVEEIA